MATTLERILAAVTNHLGAALVREGINRRALAVLGDKPVISSARLSGDVIEFTARVDDISYQCYQNRDGEIVVYRDAEKGVLVFEGLVKAESNGLLSKTSVLAVESFDEQGRLLKRAYPNGVVEYFDREGNLIGLEDPLIGESRVESAVQRTKRAVWKEKVSARKPRRIVPRELGKLKDVPSPTVDDKPIIVSAKNYTSAIPVSKAMSEAAPLAVASSVHADQIDVFPAAIAGASAMILMSSHDNVLPFVADMSIVSENSHLSSGSSCAVASTIESDLPHVHEFLLRPAASDEDARREGCERMSFREDSSDIIVEESLGNATSSPESAMRAAGAQALYSETDGFRSDVEDDMREHAAFMVFDRREKRQRHEEISSLPACAVESGACAVSGRLVTATDGSEYAAEAPRYPAVPVSAPIVPAYKAEIKSPRIVADASDPEQAGYDQPDDDGRGRRERDDQTSQDDDEPSSV